MPARDAAGPAPRPVWRSTAISSKVGLGCTLARLTGERRKAGQARPTTFGPGGATHSGTGALRVEVSAVVEHPAATSVTWSGLVRWPGQLPVVQAVVFADVGGQPHVRQVADRDSDRGSDD